MQSVPETINIAEKWQSTVSTEHEGNPIGLIGSGACKTAIKVSIGLQSCVCTFILARLCIKASNMLYFNPGMTSLWLKNLRSNIQLI